jgi:DNA recombination protein RmuC
MNTSLILLFLFLIFVALGAVFFILFKKGMGGATEEKMGALMERLAQLGQQNNELRQELDRKLSETHRTNQEQFGQTTKIVQNITNQSARLIADVTEKLTKLDETNKQVINFSGQLQNLQDILKNPKQRGVLGEYFLEETLKNVLPPNSYAMQYSLGLNEKTNKELIVDAVVFVKDKVIPVDAKFSFNSCSIFNCSRLARL